jgi:S-adenosyl methyltransferase
MNSAPPQRVVDRSSPHPARVYDYLLGGKDHYVVDEQLAEQLPPWAAVAARQNRAFMRRAVAWLAAQGCTQFLDIGTGIPTEPNLHQVVQAVNPVCRVAYADNDPVVLRHAEALLVSTEAGATDYIEADVRDPGAILDHARGFLDFEQPVVLSLIALMHFIRAEEDAYGIVRTLVDALPSGSHLVLSHTSQDGFTDEEKELAAAYSSRITFQDRTRDEVVRFFDGLELVGAGPGMVRATEWSPTGPRRECEASVLYAGVGYKP